MFRDAGLRILNDEPQTIADIEVVLDGYDPERRIGYEYIADGEASASPSTEAFATGAQERRLLVVPACSLSELRRVASTFLADIEVVDAGTSQR